MIYMVEMALDDAARETEWHAWYLRHIRRLLTVPGFRASQRFAALVDTPSPFLALHEVASPALFESREYRAVGGPSGTGEWQHRMSNWHRNLYEGLETTPEIDADSCLLVVADGADPTLPAATRLHWLGAVGLDRTMPRRALAVVAERQPFLALAQQDQRVRLYRPLTGKLRAG